MSPAPHPARGARGITLLECVIALAVLAALMGMALPSFGDAMLRARLRSAAEDLALGLGNARLESVRNGADPLHVTMAPGAEWCWSVGSVASADCQHPASEHTIQAVNGTNYPGITMTRGASSVFDGRGPLATAGVAAEFTSTQGHVVRVNVTPLGRATICTLQGGSVDFPRC